VRRAAQAAPPQRIKITYEVTAKGMAADAVETVEHDGKTYTIVSETKDEGVALPVELLQRYPAERALVPILVRAEPSAVMRRDGALLKNFERGEGRLVPWFRRRSYRSCRRARPSRRRPPPSPSR